MVQKIIQYRQYVYFIEEPKKVLKQIKDDPAEFITDKIGIYDPT